MTDRELMQQALDALEKHVLEYETVEALRARLAQPEPEELGEVIPADEEQLKRIAKLIEPEPVAWVAYENGEKHGIDFDEDEIAELPVGTLLYTAPPQREWQGLTDEEIREFEIWLDDEEEKHGWNPPADIVKYIEAKLKEKNT